MHILLFMASLVMDFLYMARGNHQVLWYSRVGKKEIILALPPKLVDGAVVQIEGRVF
jgi:hypothetical protein